MRFVIYGNISPVITKILQDKKVRSLLSDIATGQEDLLQKYSQEVLTLLTDQHMIKKEHNRYVFGPRIVFIDQELEQQLYSIACKNSETYADSITQQATSVRDTLADIFPGVMERYTWDYLSPILLGGFLMDLAVGNRLYENYSFPEKGWLLCYSSQVNPESQIGVRLVPAPKKEAVIGLFWNLLHSNANTYFSAEDAQTMKNIYCGHYFEVSDQLQVRLLRLLYMKAVIKDRFSYEVDVPVFLLSRFVTVEKRIKRIAGYIVENIINPDLQRVSALFRQFTDGQSEYVGKVVYNRLLMELTYEQLKVAGVVGTPAESQTRCWGAWMWLKDLSKPYPFLNHVCQW